MKPASLQTAGLESPRVLVPEDTTLRMIKAYFLVQAENLTDFPRLLEAVQGMDGVTSAVRVMGPYDIVAEAEGLPEESLHAMRGALSNADGVIRVVTAPGTVVSRNRTGSPRAA